MYNRVTPMWNRLNKHFKPWGTEALRLHLDARDNVPACGLQILGQKNSRM
jgi:hypothetical protein